MSLVAGQVLYCLPAERLVDGSVVPPCPLETKLGMPRAEPEGRQRVGLDRAAEDDTVRSLRCKAARRTNALVWDADETERRDGNRHDAVDDAEGVRS